MSTREIWVALRVNRPCKADRNVAERIGRAGKSVVRATRIFSGGKALDWSIDYLRRGRYVGDRLGSEFPEGTPRLPQPPGERYHTSAY